MNRSHIKKQCFFLLVSWFHNKACRKYWSSVVGTSDFDMTNVPTFIEILTYWKVPTISEFTLYQYMSPTVSECFLNKILCLILCIWHLTFMSLCGITAWLKFDVYIVWCIILPYSTKIITHFIMAYTDNLHLISLIWSIVSLMFIL